MAPASTSPGFQIVRDLKLFSANPQSLRKLAAWSMGCCRPVGKSASQTGSSAMNEQGATFLRKRAKKVVHIDVKDDW